MNRVLQLLKSAGCSWVEPTVCSMWNRRRGMKIDHESSIGETSICPGRLMDSRDETQLIPPTLQQVIFSNSQRFSAQARTNLQTTAKVEKLFAGMFWYFLELGAFGFSNGRRNITPL